MNTCLSTLPPLTAAEINEVSGGDVVPSWLVEPLTAAEINEVSGGGVSPSWLVEPEIKP